MLDDSHFAWKGRLALGAYTEAEKLGILISPRAFVQGGNYIRRLAPHFCRWFALINPRAYLGGKACNFSESQAYYTVYRERAIYNNLLRPLKSQSLYRGGGVLHISSYFSQNSSYFLILSTYFQHIPSWSSSKFLQVPRPMKNEGGGRCTCRFQIVTRSLRHLPEHDVINGGEGDGGRGCTRKFQIYLRAKN